MLDKKNIDHLAELARLRLTDEESLALGKDLEGILNYVNQLAETKIENLPDPSSGLTQNVVREDGNPIINSPLNEEIIQHFPTKDGRNLKIPPVF
jgi:aspartyl-tRNA(Asn)/glutamyl-tRNA(Gln) amidotransferase subunit C